MAEVFPFRGYRYSLGRVDKIADVVTQPYDKISPAMKDAYLSRHPKNIVRVIKNEDYDAAGAHLAAWIEEGTLVRDDEPSFYVYEQEFRFGTEVLCRTGFIGLVSLAEPSLAVKGHENILSGPLEDRLELIRRTEANEGLVFLLYSDPEGLVERVLEAIGSDLPPLFEMVDEYGVTHRLWKSSDPEQNSSLSGKLRDIPFYIADGHHRFRTSTLFHQECRAKGWKPAAPESYDKRMAAFYSMESPGLRILATHRGIHNLEQFDRDRLLNSLQRHFQVSRLGSAEEVTSAVASAPHGIGFCTASPEDNFLLVPRAAAIEGPDFMPAVNGPARSLCVNILHEGILEPLLEIDAARLAAGRYVEYFRDGSELLRELRQGRFQAAFLLTPTTVQQVREISEMGRKMPQKSTDFYPKLLTGLVLMKMEIKKE